MARKKRADISSTAEPNLTPMIDCTFQLIIFFIITAQMSNEELAPMLVPKPDKSRAIAPGGSDEVRPDVVIVNVYSEFEDKEKIDGGKTHDNEPILAMQAEGYRVKSQEVEVGNTEVLVEMLKQEKAIFDAKKKGAGATFYVEVRADRDISYDQILPVMRSAAEAGIAKMYMTAVTDPNYKGKR